MKLIRLWLICFPVMLFAQDSSVFSKTEIIYGRKDGMALTMFKVSPKKHFNGKAIISLVSGDWKSSFYSLQYYLDRSAVYTNRGYTIFLVMLGSQPRYTLPDEVADVKRAVRFVRYNALVYGIDPGHIGITGFSSGGHLSLVVATADDPQNTAANDPVDRISAKVQAVAVFFPPTDFLGFGPPFFDKITKKFLPAAASFAAAFDFKVLDSTTRTYKPISDSIWWSMVKKFSPVYSVMPTTPPTLIVHGDIDTSVPIQQSKSMIKKLNDAGVVNRLVVATGKSHGWDMPMPELSQCADWFDSYLR